MILKKQSFNYQDKVLIEKATIQPPYKHERSFQNEGCFLYMKGAQGKVLSSKEVFEFDNEPREAVLLQCDTYFLDFVKPVSNEKIEIIAIHLYPDVLKKIYVNDFPKLIQKQTTTAQTQRIIDKDIISKFIDSLEFYFENTFLVNDDLLELKIKELVLLLIQTKNVTSISKLISDSYSTKTSTITELIDLHLYSNLTIEELAKLCGMSLSSFKREFKKQFNDSPINYINNKRIDKAKELLSFSAHSISEIGYQIGFNDPQYFARIFKTKMGISPSNYRDNNQINQ